MKPRASRNPLVPFLQSKMNTSRLLLAVTTLIFFAALAISPLNAGSMGNGAAQREKLVVDSVDVTGGIIVLKSMVDNSIQTYKIDATTHIILGHTKGSIDQITVGLKVANLRAVAGAPPQTLQTLLLYPATPAPAPPPANQSRLAIHNRFLLIPKFRGQANGQGCQNQFGIQDRRFN